MFSYNFLELVVKSDALMNGRHDKGVGELNFAASFCLSAVWSDVGVLLNSDGDF